MKLHFIISKLLPTRLVIMLAILTLTSYKGISQNFGYFASAIDLNVNGSQQYYNTSPGTLNANSINPAPGAPFFTGNLGSFVTNSGLLNIKGGEIKTFKNGGGNVCGATLFYRIYKTGDAAPVFSPLTLPFFSNCSGSTFPDAGGGPCSGNDQKWGTFTESLDLTNRCPGNYTFDIFYTVTGSSSGGCGETVYDSNNGNNYTVTFSITSDMQVAVMSNSSICTGNTLNLNTSVTGGNSTYTYLWNGPLGYTSTDAAPVISGLGSTASGTYSVAVTDGCNNVSNANTEVTINALPNNAEGTVTDPTCAEPTGTILINAPVSGVSYSFDNGITYGSVNSRTGMAPGDYQVKVKDNVTGCESIPVVLTIQNALAIPVATPSSNSPQCTGPMIELIAADAGAGTTYSWTGPNSFISTDQNPQIPYSTSALGTYTLTVTNPQGCSAMATTEVTCSALPVRLVSFRGETIENIVQLQWEAVDAANFSYFDIERSGNATSFDKITRVYYKDQQQFYTLKDLSPLTGTNYYRLNMVDIDGTNAYSKAINVKYDKEGEDYAYLENPSNSNQIHLFTNTKPLSINLVNSIGNEIPLKFTQLNDKEWLIESGNMVENQVSLIRITDKKGTLVRKFVKSK